MAHSDGGRGAPRGGVTCWNPAAGMVFRSHSNHLGAAALSFPLIQVRKHSADFRDSKPFNRERASHTLMTTSQEDHT